TSPEQIASITSGDSDTATIDNDDSASLSITAPTITETNSNFTATFAVTLTGDVQDGFDVAISSLGLTADEVTDYTLDTSSLHFAGTDGEVQYVTVTIKGDTVVEDNETFSVTLGAVSGTSPEQIASITSGDSDTATIDND